jgi:hypothetical protein
MAESNSSLVMVLMAAQRALCLLWLKCVREEREGWGRGRERERERGVEKRERNSWEKNCNKVGKERSEEGGEEGRREKEDWERSGKKIMYFECILHLSTHPRCSPSITIHLD